MEGAQKTSPLLLVIIVENLGTFRRIARNPKAQDKKGYRAYVLGAKRENIGVMSVNQNIIKMAHLSLKKERKNLKSQKTRTGVFS